jgi:hypothetical protein
MNNKIGFLETYNKDAQKVEKSSDRLKSLISLGMIFIIVILQIILGKEFNDWGFAVIVFLFLLYSAAPKALEKIAIVKYLKSKVSVKG